MKGPANTQSAGGHSVDILLVEDSEADIKITLRAFSKAKIQRSIFVVRDGQEALDYMFHQNEYADESKFPYPAIIVLDIQLPKLTGFEVLQALKKDDKIKVTPVVVLTSSKNDKDVIQSYDYGAVSFIQKPIDYQEFEKVVEGFNVYWHVISKLPNFK